MCYTFVIMCFSWRTHSYIEINNIEFILFINYYMKVLITGGNGNIAKLIKNGLSSEFSIYAPSRNELNVLNFTDLQTFLLNHQFDILIHTCILGGRRTKEENGDVSHTNILMFEHILKFEKHFKMIINLDSGAIYDRKTDILNRKEDELITVPEDYYGFSKYVIYNRSLSFSNIFNFRIFNIFHENEEPSRFIASCFDAKNKNKQIDIHEDKTFDFMYKDDFIKIVRFYLQNVDNLSILEKTINIGYDQKYNLSDIAKMILDICADKCNSYNTDEICESENNNYSQINIIVNKSSNNYSGCVNKLYAYNIEFDGLKKGLSKYAENIYKKNM
jgi:nucleoside-diphosphate-sugar epimerase